MLKLRIEKKPLCSRRLCRTLSLIFLCLFLTGCTYKVIEEDMARPRSKGKTAGQSRRGDKSRKRELIGPDPVIRVGLMEEYDKIEFQLDGAFDIVSLGGEILDENIKTDQIWHVVPDQTTEARAVYSVLTTAFGKRDAADSLRRTLSQKNYPSRVAEVGEEIIIDDRSIANNIKYRVLVGRFPTEREAKSHLDAFKNEFAPRIIRQIVRPSTGTIELFDEDFSHSRLIKDGIRLIPKTEESKVMLFAVREGTGFHWEREVDRVYDGIIEIRLDPRALLMALTELPLEQYLKGVVPSEMPASYPMEALKAQSVAARSEVLSKIGVKHLNDPFDLCANVHCQVYSGCTDVHERTNEAVEATRGQVLMLDGHVAEAVYSSCCGGHTENKVNVWNPPGAKHLEGRWDTGSESEFESKYDLTSEIDVEKWINSSPSVWCNVNAFENMPRILAYSSRYFRWQVSYPRRELEDIIKRKSGEDIGTLMNIIPLKRGISGRLMEIEIQGTHKNLRIQRELNIRRVLSSSYLYSACFTVEVEFGEDFRPINFILNGAGWGHGVGMCQVGAGVMAGNKNNYRKILTHYYPATKVEKVYGD